MNIIFFDGYCGLCDGFVNFMLRADKKGIFKYSPLQSEYAKNLLPAELTTDMKSVVVLIDGEIHLKSTGVLRALAALGGPWKLTSLFRILPPQVSNIAYDLVAENRYRIFGKKETCRLPTPEETSRFIL